MNKEQHARLIRPFPDEAVGKKPYITCTACSKSPNKACDSHPKKTCKTCKNWITPKHDHLDFIGHAYVTERLNEEDPDWDWEPLAFDERGLPVIDNGVLWIRLTIHGKTRLGVGDADGKRGGNAIKEMIGDAIRNAGMRFGIALDYWKRERPAAPLDSEPAAAPQATPKADQPRTTEQIRAGLRNDIMAEHQRKGTALAARFDDFAGWSQGTAFKDATDEMLTAYLAHLRGEVKAS